MRTRAQDPFCNATVSGALRAGCAGPRPSVPLLESMTCGRPHSGPVRVRHAGALDAERVADFHVVQAGAAAQPGQDRQVAWRRLCLEGAPARSPPSKPGRAPPKSLQTAALLRCCAPVLELVQLRACRTMWSFPSTWHPCLAACPPARTGRRCHRSLPPEAAMSGLEVLMPHGAGVRFVQTTP